MRSISPILTLALVLASGSLAGGQDGAGAEPRLRFGSRSAAVGDLSIEQSREALDLKAAYTVDGKVVREIDQKTLKVSDLRIEVLAVAGDNIQKLRVAFKKIVLQGRARGGAPVTEDGLSGRTFIVTQTGPRLRVVEEKGKEMAVTREDGEWVRSEVRSLFRDEGRRFGLAVPPRGLRFGERVEVSKALASRLLDLGDAAFAIDKVSLTLKRRERIAGVACGVFAVAIAGRSRGSVPEQVLKLRGEVAIEVATGRQRRLKLKGPIELSGSQQDGAGTIAVKGRGSMQLNRVSAYPTGGGEAGED